MPMIIRPTGQGKAVKVIGPCQVHGIMDAEAVLGPVPAPWKIEFYRDSMGVAVHHFRNSETDQLTIRDPRLGCLPKEWKCIERDRTIDDPRWFNCFVNKVSGETTNADPRMREDELRKHGIIIQRFEIV
jgi:hypothetical protein